MEVIVVPFGVATLTKLAGRELGMVPGRHTTGQLTPTTGEAGLGLRARLETSNVPFMSHKKTSASLCCTVSQSSFCTPPLLLLVKPHLRWGGDSTVTNRKQVVYDESRRRCKGGRAFLFSRLSSLVAQKVKDVCGGASLPHQWSGGVRLVL